MNFHDDAYPFQGGTNSGSDILERVNGRYREVSAFDGWSMSFVTAIE
jgi:hypothetical protein